MGFHWLWMWISSLPSHQRHCLKHHNNNNIKTFKPQKETVEHCGSVSREVNALSWAEISSGENLVIPIRGCFLPVCFYKSRFFVTEKRDSHFIVMLCAFLDFSADDSRYLFVIEPWKAQRGMDLAHCFRSCASEKMLRCFTGEGQTFDDLNRWTKWGRAGKKQDWSGWRRNGGRGGCRGMKVGDGVNALSHSQMRISSHKFSTCSWPGLCLHALIHGRDQTFPCLRLSVSVLLLIHKQFMTFWRQQGKIQPEPDSDEFDGSYSGQVRSGLVTRVTKK